MDIKSVKDNDRKAKKISTAEVVWIVIVGIIALGGLFLLTAGIVGDYLQVMYSENWILKASDASIKATGLSWRQWGAIVIVVDAIITTIILNFFAKKGDKDDERENRRAQRLQVLSKSEEPKQEPVEVPSTPVEK